MRPLKKGIFLNKHVYIKKLDFSKKTCIMGVVNLNWGQKYETKTNLNLEQFYFLKTIKQF